MIVTVPARTEIDRHGLEADAVAALSEIAAADHAIYGRSDGHLVPPQIQPRALAELAYNAGWHDAHQLWISVAVCLAESQGYQRAFNDNLDDVAGTVKSRDVGLWEINIPASQIGTPAELSLYDPVANVSRAFSIWQAGGWNRWASWTSGVAMRDYYAARAALGVFNYLAEYGHQLSGTLKVPIFTLAELREHVKW